MFCTAAHEVEDSLTEEERAAVSSFETCISFLSSLAFLSFSSSHLLFIFPLSFTFFLSLQFQQENAQLFDHMSSLVDEVRQIEGKVVEISQLQRVFTEKVLEQVSTSL